MASEFIRDYQIIVGNDVKAFGDNAHQQTKNDATATIISGLQMTTSISLSNEKSSSQTDEVTLKILNLPAEYQDQFKSDGATLMLRAGYFSDMSRDESGNLVSDPDTLPVILLATIYHCYTQREGVNDVTYVFCSTDKVERATTKDSIAFPPGTKLQEIIQSLVKRMPFALKSIDLGTANGRVYQGGLSLYGKVADMLNNVCEENGLVWHVHNKKITVQPKKPSAQSKVYPWDIHPGSMIESVKATYSRSQTKLPKKPSKVDTAPKPGERVSIADGMKTVIKQGVTVTVLLDGRLLLGDYVRLNDVGDLSGDYRIEGINHSLDYRGGEWTTALDLVAA